MLPTQLLRNLCKEVIFVLCLSVRLPCPAKSILTWDFVHLTAQMGCFS